MKHLVDMYNDAKKDGGYTSERMRFALGNLLHDMDMAGYMNSDYYDIEGFFHKGIDIKADEKINMGMLKKAYAQAKNLPDDTRIDPEIFTRGGSAMKSVATEGNSPHKKGTKKYKAHMAAMHANSAEPEGQMIETKEEKPKTVTLEDMRSVLELDKDTTPLDIVSNYVKTTLDETFDTWPKVRQQVDYILSRVNDTNSVSSDEVFDKVFKENLQSQLDEQVMVSENIDTLRDIVNNKSAMTVKFQDGTMKVDMTTANIFLQAYNKMKESNQMKIAEMMKTKKGFLRVLDFIYGAMK